MMISDRPLLPPASPPAPSSDQMSSAPASPSALPRRRTPAVDAQGSCHTLQRVVGASHAMYWTCSAYYNCALSRALYPRVCICPCVLSAEHLARQQFFARVLALVCLPAQYYISRSFCSFRIRSSCLRTRLRGGIVESVCTFRLSLLPLYYNNNNNH